MVRRKPWKSDCTADTPHFSAHIGSVQESDADTDTSGIRSATAASTAADAARSLARVTCIAGELVRAKA